MPPTENLLAETYYRLAPKNPLYFQPPAGTLFEQLLLLSDSLGGGTWSKLTEAFGS